MMKKFINARIYGHGAASEMLVEDGKFKAIGQNLPEASEVIDLAGRLVLPPYVDPHIHLDYVYTGLEGSQNGSDSGTLFEGIQRWSEIKKSDTVEKVKARALRGIYEEMSHGVQYIRTHVDVTDPNLTGMKAMLELREELRDKLTLQIVSFPQESMYTYPRGLELVEEGLKMGADAVGGIPHTELAREYGEKSLHKIVELAVKYDKMIDVHIDENDDPQSRFVELLNALVTYEGLGARTAASHTCSFGSADDSYAYRMLGNFQKSGMNFIVCPTENAYLQGRYDTYPKRRGLTRVREFVDHNINVGFAQDSIADLFYPAGNGNLMNILDNGIHLTQLMDDTDFEKNFNLITYNNAKTLMLPAYGLKEGYPANFIVLDSHDVYEAQRTRAGVLASVRNGEYLFKKQPVTYDVELSL